VLIAESCSGDLPVVCVFGMGTLARIVCIPNRALSTSRLSQDASRCSLDKPVGPGINIKVASEPTQSTKDLQATLFDIQM
jgi:hypothetical protein